MIRITAKTKTLFFVPVILCIQFISCSSKEIGPDFSYAIPEHFSTPVYDLRSNPAKKEVFELGKALFYDPILSRDGSISCGSCHQQEAAFAQKNHSLSHGIDDQLTLRNSPSLSNLAWYPSFFWDGGVFHLDLVSPAPIQNPVEMDESLPNVLNKLRRSPKYRQKFREAFGSEDIQGQEFLLAIAQFQLHLVSANAPFDAYLKGDENALNSLQKEGYELFKEHCQNCHIGPLLTDFSFRGNGIPLRNPNDTGRYRITLNEEDRYHFRVPSLRNVAYSSPYMHDGRFKTLEEVLEHYRTGIEDTVWLDPSLKNSAQEVGIRLSDEESTAIVSFLESLSDPSFITNPKFDTE